MRGVQGRQADPDHLGGVTHHHTVQSELPGASDRRHRRLDVPEGHDRLREETPLSLRLEVRQGIVVERGAQVEQFAVLDVGQQVDRAEPDGVRKQHLAETPSRFIIASLGPA